ncbi:thioredoxin family protein [Clostridium sp. LIBA-8841]|uniref:thioredoxin family protein n=1 Tax=Clostridium sp. LIBA-8841 TaxID=2987530 RepID=UPI002AC54649|nr:thioredoxin family protein [Clostridium sp. LIBA-8841]MDZ5254137.1 thioredoxin family protein [Clostridium sp. LIBA-8841]
MLDMKSGLTYEEYLRTATDEEREMIKEFFNRVAVCKEKIKEIDSIKDKVDIAVFSITRCKDAASAIPFLIKLSENNKNINIKFWDREGNEELLEELSGARRVPSILKIENGQIVKSYIEFPRVVDKKINHNPEEKENLVNDLRSNKYDKEIEEEIFNIIK